MPSDLEICNGALLRLGQTQIASFTDGDSGTVCEELYSRLKDSILGMHPWRHANKTQQLARDAVAPLLKWSYKYQLPTDKLEGGPMAVYSSIGTGAQITTDFDIVDGELHTNHDVIAIEYLYRAPESTFPAWFVMLIEFALAAAIAPDITDQQTLAKEYHERAWGTPSEGFSGGWFAVCVTRNDQSHPTGQLEDDGILETTRFG